MISMQTHKRYKGLNKIDDGNLKRRINTIYAYKVNRMCTAIIDTLNSNALIQKHANIYYELRPITCSS